MTEPWNWRPEGSDDDESPVAREMARMMAYLTAALGITLQHGLAAGMNIGELVAEIATSDEGRGEVAEELRDWLNHGLANLEDDESGLPSALEVFRNGLSIAITMIRDTEQSDD